MTFLIVRLVHNICKRSFVVYSNLEEARNGWGFEIKTKVRRGLFIRTVHWHSSSGHYSKTGNIEICTSFLLIVLHNIISTTTIVFIKEKNTSRSNGYQTYQK